MKFSLVILLSYLTVSLVYFPLLFSRYRIGLSCFHLSVFFSSLSSSYWHTLDFLFFHFSSYCRVQKALSRQKEYAITRFCVCAEESLLIVLVFLKTLTSAIFILCIARKKLIALCLCRGSLLRVFLGSFLLPLHPSFLLILLFLLLIFLA